jgi:hypothetical protein
MFQESLRLACLIYVSWGLAITKKKIFIEDETFFIRLSINELSYKCNHVKYMYLSMYMMYLCNNLDQVRSKSKD